MFLNSWVKSIFTSYATLLSEGIESDAMTDFFIESVTGWFTKKLSSTENYKVSW